MGVTRCVGSSKVLTASFASIAAAEKYGEFLELPVAFSRR